jgi:hypothetical protein
VAGKICGAVCKTLFLHNHGCLSRDQSTILIPLFHILGFFSFYGRVVRLQL